MKKHAVLIALVSALAIGGTTASFAQASDSGSMAPGTTNRAKTPQQAPSTQAAPPSSGATGQKYVPGYGKTGAGTQPSGQ